MTDDEILKKHIDSLPLRAKIMWWCGFIDISVKNGKIARRAAAWNPIIYILLAVLLISYIIIHIAKALEEFYEGVKEIFKWG